MAPTPHATLTEASDGWRVVPGRGAARGPFPDRTAALEAALDYGYTVRGVALVDLEEARARLAADAAARALSPAQRVAVRAIMRGAPYQDAAHEAGVDRSTLWRWRRSPAFLEALRAEGRASQAAAPPRLVALRDAALGRVADLLPSMPARDLVRLLADLCDRTGLHRDAVALPPEAAPEVNPTTPEGRAALLADLRCLPAEVLLEALRGPGPDLAAG